MVHSLRERSLELPITESHRPIDGGSPSSACRPRDLPMRRLALPFASDVLRLLPVIVLGRRMAI